MRSLNSFEINLISGGDLSLVIVGGCAIAMASFAAYTLYTSEKGYSYKSIDLSKLTPEDAYNIGYEKGIQDGYALGYLFPMPLYH